MKVTNYFQLRNQSHQLHQWDAQRASWDWHKLQSSSSKVLSNANGWMRTKRKGERLPYLGNFKWIRNLVQLIPLSIKYFLFGKWSLATLGKCLWPISRLPSNNWFPLSSCLPFTKFPRKLIYNFNKFCSARVKDIPGLEI